MPHKPYFLTFGGGAPGYRHASLRLAWEARSSSVFERVMRFTDRTLHRCCPDFVQQHGEFVAQNPRGYGYWLWKPYLVREVLSRLAPGRVLVYADAGCELNFTNTAAERRFRDYVDTAQSQGMTIFATDYPTALWAKSDLLRHFGVAGEEQWLGQVEANVLLVSSSSAGRALVDDWYEACIAQQYHFLDDSPSQTGEAPEFIDHRHDQAVLSCLVRSNGELHLFGHETYFGPDMLPLMQEWRELAADPSRWPLSDQTLSAVAWFGERSAAKFAQIDPRLESITWRRTGAAFPIWSSRNISGLPAHRRGVLGASARKLRIAATRVRRFS